MIDLFIVFLFLIRNIDLGLIFLNLKPNSRRFFQTSSIYHSSNDKISFAGYQYNVCKLPACKQPMSHKGEDCHGN